MPKPVPEELKKYQEYIKKRLAQLTPILQKAAIGDFTGKIKIPKKEDEFSELFVGLSLMMDDLHELEEARKKIEETRKERLAELEEWKKLTEGRELRMAELKDKIKKLEEEMKNLEKTSKLAE